MTSVQDRLFAYILTMLPDVDQASDVLQEANVVMWRKRLELGEAQSFEAWACRVAYFEVLSFRRNRHRDRHVFSEELIERISAASLEKVSGQSAVSIAIEDCIGELSDRDSDLLRERYQENTPVTDIARQVDKTPAAVSTALHRIRRSLRDCIARRLGWETRS